MDTDEIMAVALQQAGLDSIPGDSEIYIPGSHLKRVLFGIDVDVGELLFASQAGFDAVIAHHPVGGQTAVHFTDVMWRMVEQMSEEGVAEQVARAAVSARIAKVKRRRHVTNYNRVLDTARMIGLPFMNIHLPPDIVSRQVIRDLLTNRLPKAATVADLITLLQGIPEIEGSVFQPEAWIGGPENQVGRHTVAIAGGTNGGYPVFKAYFDAGVQTILAMHIDEDDFRALEREAPPGCNLVITGHIATDSVGINCLIAGLEGRGLAVTRTSGIIAA